VPACGVGLGEIHTQAGCPVPGDPDLAGLEPKRARVCMRTSARPGGFRRWVLTFSVLKCRFGSWMPFWYRIPFGIYGPSIPLGCHLPAIDTRQPRRGRPPAGGARAASAPPGLVTGSGAAEADGTAVTG